MIADGRLIWSVGLGTTLGMAAQSASSFLFYALKTAAGLTVEQATQALTAEGVAMGLVMLIVSPSIHRLPLRPLLALAILAALGAQVASAQVDGYGPILAVRALSGIGFGLIYAVASASGAASPTPERVYAAAGTIQLVCGAALNPLMGWGQSLGRAGAFGAVALFGAVLAAGLLFAPPPARLASIVRAAGTRPQLAAVVAVLLAMVLFAGGANGVYIYYVPVADGVGLSGEALGYGLSGVSLVGALGGVAANRLGLSRGRIAPLGGGLLMMGAVSWWVLIVRSPAEFWVAFTLWIMIYIFVNAYLFGLAVAADPSGRLAAATGAALILANAGGTWGVGWVAARTGEASWGAVALALCAAAAVLTVLADGLIRWRAGAPAQADRRG